MPTASKSAARARMPTAGVKTPKSAMSDNTVMGNPLTIATTLSHRCAKLNARCLRARWSSRQSMSRAQPTTRRLMEIALKERECLRGDAVKGQHAGQDVVAHVAVIKPGAGIVGSHIGGE